MAVKIEVCPESGHPITKRSILIMEPYMKGMPLLKMLALPLKTRLAEDGSIVFEDHLRLIKSGFATGNHHLLPTSEISNNTPPVTVFAILCSFFPLSMHYIGGLSVKEGIKLGASKYHFQSKLENKLTNIKFHY